jgi:hypothetical protein
MAEQPDISLVERQSCAIEFCVRLGKNGSMELHQNIRHVVQILPHAISGFRSDQEVKTSCSTIVLKLAANCLQHVFEKWVKRCKKCIA